MQRGRFQSVHRVPVVCFQLPDILSSKLRALALGLLIEGMEEIMESDLETPHTHQCCPIPVTLLISSPALVYFQQLSVNLSFYRPIDDQFRIAFNPLEVNVNRR